MNDLTPSTPAWIREAHALESFIRAQDMARLQALLEDGATLNRPFLLPGPTAKRALMPLCLGIEEGWLDGVEVLQAAGAGFLVLPPYAGRMNLVGGEFSGSEWEVCLACALRSKAPEAMLGWLLAQPKAWFDAVAVFRGQHGTSALGESRWTPMTLDMPTPDAFLALASRLQVLSANPWLLLLPALSRLPESWWTPTLREHLIPLLENLKAAAPVDQAMLEGAWFAAMEGEHFESRRDFLTQYAPPCPTHPVQPFAVLAARFNKVELLSRLLKDPAHKTPFTDTLAVLPELLEDILSSARTFPYPSPGEEDAALPGLPLIRLLAHHGLLPGETTIAQWQGKTHALARRLYLQVLTWEEIRELATLWPAILKTPFGGDGAPSIMDQLGQAYREGRLGFDGRARLERFWLEQSLGQASPQVHLRERL